MVTRMVLCPIIPYFSVSWPPKVAELLMAIPALEPLEFHGNWFGGLGRRFYYWWGCLLFCCLFIWAFVVACGLGLQVYCTWGLLFLAFKNNAPSFASAADEITLRMIVDMMMTAPLFEGFSSSFDRKWWPPRDCVHSFWKVKMHRNWLPVPYHWHWMWRLPPLGIRHSQGIIWPVSLYFRFSFF